MLPTETTIRIPRAPAAALSRHVRTFAGIWLIPAVFVAVSPRLAGQSHTGCSIAGQVSAVGPDHEAFTFPGAMLTLTGAAESQATTDEQGRYAFDGLPVGTYTVEVALQGFHAARRTLSLEAGQSAIVDLMLELAAHDEVTVTTDGRGSRPSHTAPPTDISRRTLQQVPIAAEQYESALPLVPGVIRGPDGMLATKGSREDQSALRVSNASGADPVTGEFAFRLPIEAVRSLEVVTSPYAPEYGKMSGGVTNIETTGGSTEWKVQVQDLEPRIRRRGEHIRGIESWTPRVAVGGPLAPAIAMFESMEYQFTRTLVEGLPENEADTSLESYSSFSRVDWAAGTNDHLSAAVAVFPQRLGYLGLNAFNPQSVTANVHQSASLWTAGERRILNSAAFLESHGSVQLLDTHVFPAVAGSGAMVLAPDTNSGTYFNSQQRASSRYEGLVELSALPGRTHVVKAGLGVSRESYDGATESLPVLIVRTDGSRAEEIDTAGAAALSRTKTEVLAFVQDAWTVRDRLTLQYGVRYDRDSIAGTHNVAPRIGASFAPTADSRTVVRGGAGLFFEKLTLGAASFDQLPARIVTRDGSGQAMSFHSDTIQQPEVAGGVLDNPLSVAWNVEMDRELTDRLGVRVGWRQRDGSRQLIVEPGAGSAIRQALTLSNAGNNRYREFEVTGRYRVRSDQLVVSYIRSAATGDLNDLRGLVGNLVNPIVRPNEYSRLSFDAPNRLLAWGEFDLPAGFGVAPLAEIRDGFPLSIYDEYHDYVGGRNRAGRFPRFFSLDVQAWKHVTLPWPRRLQARIGIKVFNVTDHFNPRDFQGNLTSTRFGEFANGVGRTFRGKFVFDF